MSDIAEMLAENQKEMMKRVNSQKSSAHQNLQDSDPETENISVARTSTPVKKNTVTSKTTPTNSRNRFCHSPWKSKCSKGHNTILGQ